MKYGFTLLLLVASSALCQESTPDRVTVPFSDASRPRMVKCSLLNGAISVKGYEGKDVIVAQAIVWPSIQRAMSKRR